MTMRIILKQAGKIFIVAASAALITSCTTKPKEEMETVGTVERIDPALDAVISGTPSFEVIAKGYEWSEGPVWVPAHNMLLFSDVPKNTIYKWTEEKGAETFLSPSGYTGTTPLNTKEPGSNGLTLNKDGKLVLCQHGDRRIAMMDAPLENPTAAFVTVAGKYDDKRFNSPNDLAFRSNGDLFFTDPPYGLPMRNEQDPTKETPYQGVYKVTPSGEVVLLVDSLTRPNGIALTPDEKTLIVANSDPDKAMWYAFDIDENDSLTNARIFYDATADGKKEPGAPDGFKIDKQGNMFASGPGGIWIFDMTGKVLGKIKLTDRASNCALADDDKTLYVTNNHQILRIKLRP